MSRPPGLTFSSSSPSSSLVGSSNGPSQSQALSLPYNNKRQQLQLLHRTPQQPRIVLSEEEYTATLESIVQRDYFPDLAGLERQVAVLDRRAQGDATGAIAIRRAARQLQHHEQALVDQEVFDEQEMTKTMTSNRTSTSTANTNTNTNTATMIRKRPRPLHRETITGFHARVTNEDDEDFNETQTEQIQAHRNYLNEVFQPTTIVTNVNDTPLLEYQMASDQFQPSTFRTSIEKSLVHQPAKLRNSLFFVPTPLHQQELEELEQQQQQQQQQEQLEYSKPQSHRIMNGILQPPLAIMPPPSIKKARTNTTISTTTTTSTATISTDLMVAVTSPSNISGPQLSSSALVVLHDPNKNQSIVLAKQDLVEYIPKHSLEKKIQPSETRFPSSMMGFGNHHSRIVPFIGGDNNGDFTTMTMTDYYNNNGGTTTDDASTDLDTDSSSMVSSTLARERHLRDDKRRRDQNSFVTMTPLIIPGSSRGGGGGGNDSPVMTWGTLASTPLILSSGQEKQSPHPPAQQEDDSVVSSSFSIAAESKRDRVARKAQEQLEQRAKRIKEIKGSSSRRSRSSSSSSSSSNNNTNTSTSMSSRGGSQTREQQLLRSLTPAARSLMERTTAPSKRTIGSSSSSSSISFNNNNTTQALLRPSSRARDAFGSALRGSYGTPAAAGSTTISRHHPQSNNGARDHAHQATPQASQYQRATSNATPRNNNSR